VLLDRATAGLGSLMPSSHGLPMPNRRSAAGDCGSGRKIMAENWVQGSFAFRCLAEADLLVRQCALCTTLWWRMNPSRQARRWRRFYVPPHREPWSGLVDVMPDPEFSAIHADWSREVAPDDPNAAIIAFSSMEDF
jgi:hypothetical protein